MSASVQRKLQQAHRSLTSGNVAEAAALCEDVLQRAPRNPDALWLLGTARLMENRADLAVPVLERALAAAPDRGATLESLGLAYLLRGEYAAAEPVLRKAASKPAAPPSARMRLGLALLHLGQHAAAIDELERVLVQAPGDPDVRLALGRAYAGVARWAAAAREFEHALALAPHQLDALFNLALARIELGDLERARASLERILALDPTYVDARERLAALALRVGRYVDAVRQLRELLATRPDDGAAHVALAEACFQSGALDDAADAAQRALALEPGAAGAYSVLARVHYIRGELDRAVEALERGEEVNDSGPLLGLRMHLLHRMCDWPRWQSAWECVAARLPNEADLGSPFSLLHEATTPEQQLTYTQRWAANRFANIPRAPRPRSAGSGSPDRRVRVGYFSSDFQEHAVAHLLVEALELHDRRRFEVFAYSYGPDDGSELRARLQVGIEHFIDISRQPDDLAVKRIRADELDLLVDLRGYTVGDRLEIMAERPAQVQATWLGYPGTTGADFIDYLIADDYLIPPETEQFYSERVMRMPVCYQPNDRKRPIAEPRSRSEYGLPDGAFVFCCFNQLVKVMPEVFACWMRLLGKVPSSVLWLLEDNRWAAENLRREAASRGIDPGRIVFGARLANPEHLARFRVADLALDTLPYTSHTTASDALWAGCPLVALSGETFAARVSGSILTACGFPELVTRTLDEYEALAYRLAADSDFLREIRTRLAHARSNSPIFDAQRFARDLEALFLKMVS